MPFVSRITGKNHYLMGRTITLETGEKYTFPHPDDQMEYLVDMWTRTQNAEPSLKQLVYLMALLETFPEDEPRVFAKDHLNKRQVGSIINKLSKGETL